MINYVVYRSQTCDDSLKKKRFGTATAKTLRSRVVDSDLFTKRGGGGHKTSEIQSIPLNRNTGHNRTTA